jgi:hypothetical protein
MLLFLLQNDRMLESSTENISRDEHVDHCQKEFGSDVVCHSTIDNSIDLITNRTNAFFFHLGCQWNWRNG